MHGFSLGPPNNKRRGGGRRQSEAGKRQYPVRLGKNWPKFLSKKVETESARVFVGPTNNKQREGVDIGKTTEIVAGALGGVFIYNIIINLLIYKDPWCSG